MVEAEDRMSTPNTVIVACNLKTDLSEQNVVFEATSLTLRHEL